MAKEVNKSQRMIYYEGKYLQEEMKEEQYPQIEE